MVNLISHVYCFDIVTNEKFKKNNNRGKLNRVTI